MNRKTILIDQVGASYRVLTVDPHHGKEWHHDITWDLSATEAGESALRRHALTGLAVYISTDANRQRRLVTPYCYPQAVLSRNAR